MPVLARAAAAFRQKFPPSGAEMQRRFASGGVYPWEKPTDMAAWKGEYVVILMIGLYGAIGYGGYTFMSNKKKAAAALAAAAE